MYNIDMTVLFVCLTVTMFLLLSISNAMRPIRANVSQFELKRRKEQSKVDKLTLQREASASAIEAILKLDANCLLIILSITSIYFYGWALGLFVLILIVLTYQVVSRLSVVQKAANFLYSRIEKQLLQVAERTRSFWRLLEDSPSSNSPRIHSKDELIHLVRGTKPILDSSEISRIIGSLEFSSKTVKDIMTPRSKISIADKNDLLGPATLDAFYKTGHSRLPVIDGDIDQVIGILYINNLLIATSKETPTASDVMRTPVCLVKESQSLGEALDLMLSEHQDLAVVVGKANKTVGLISLGSITRAALGQKD